MSVFSNLWNGVRLVFNPTAVKAFVEVKMEDYFGKVKEGTKTIVKSVIKPTWWIILLVVAGAILFLFIFRKVKRAVT